MATDDDDAATLRERVRDLEQTVAQQQDTIEQLLPSRRAILAGGAGLVGGAALTGQASAQSAAGQVGTSSEPVDVEAAEVTADSVNTGALGITGSLMGKRSRIDGFSTNGSLIDETISLTGDASIGYLIDVKGIFDSADVFGMQVNGDAGTNYNWSTEDGTGTFDNQDNESEFRLADPDASFEAIRAVWVISEPRDRIRISRVYGTCGQLGSNPVLHEGENTDPGTNLENSLSFTTDGAVADFDCDVYALEQA